MLEKAHQKEMKRALELDGEKLLALTGEDHGPVFLDEEIVDGAEQLKHLLDKGQGP
jgi:hypothetical protein